MTELTVGMLRKHGQDGALLADVAVLLDAARTLRGAATATVQTMTVSGANRALLFIQSYHRLLPVPPSEGDAATPRREEYGLSISENDKAEARR